ncbi:RagB/SusD family nutrient uptake outer membrane protein [Pedobacter sp.]|uniref:RagB/SusD family nutrient uptake outer membrane protein n=1 Tax=Pedobacter sp. TaxID=1411316 RepID=UPI002C3ED625|nr:RagB/SusD family nutrient uptake outer membrane protein [Pedobacter sp.]HWW42271.1 RagB/SusD family nutrient uptake outer membrane protein [Pedobacter sp.]
MKKLIHSPLNDRFISVCSYLINRIGLLIIALVFITFPSCKKLIEVGGPNTSVNSENIFEKDITASSVLTAIYSKLSAASIFQGRAITSMSYLAGLSADELTLISPDNFLKAYYTNTLNTQNDVGTQIWNNAYPDIYVINATLEGISNSTSLTPIVKQQLLGEAKFLRAFYFFYLVNLYGDVPLILSTDYKVNSLLKRTPKEKVWEQIIIDLKDAQNLLSEKYLDASLLIQTEERVRPTKWAATALLARIYLYTRNWDSAEREASILIGNNNYGLVTLNQVFKMNSKEAIWQLQPVTRNINTQDGIAFILTPETGVGTSQPGCISASLLNSFDIGDQRKKDWINSVKIDDVDYYYAYKYKIGYVVDGPVSEYSMVLRLAEQYLIRAEARIQQGKISEGLDDLNILRDRATDKTEGAVRLSKLSTSLAPSDALLAVEHERQTELFTEWGHRWLDLKRTNRVDEIMAIEVPKKIGGGVWKSFQQWFPLPTYDLQKDPNLIQNTGY